MTEINRKKPGRPAKESGEADPRARLMEVSAALFSEHGYDAVSLKRVAEGAQVTAAMVAYYFKDKEGLFLATMSKGLDELLEMFEAVLGETRSGSMLERLLRGYLGVISRNPWIPRLLVREVLSKGIFRDYFVEQFASRAVLLVPPAIAGEIENNRLRSDLDPRYTLLSLLGMCLFPFIAEPVLGPLLGYQTDDVFGAEYADHAVGLFFNGAGGEQS